jgi:hypothetical protein
MLYTVTFYTNGLQTLLLLLDANERASSIVRPANRPPISRGRVLDCEKRCKRYLNPSR